MKWTYFFAIIQGGTFVAVTHITVYDWKFWAVQIPVYLWVAASRWEGRNE